MKTRPMTYYCRLDKTEIITTQGGKNLEFFALKPDAAKLKGNYDREFIQKIMKIQGIKLRYGPVIPYGLKAAGYPVGNYGFTIDSFKDAVFCLKINDSPVFTWKGSTLLGTVDCRTVTDGDTTSPEIHCYHTQRENAYRVFKDMGQLKALKTTRNDLVKVTCDLATALVTADLEADFTITCSILVESEYKHYAG